jgi:cyclase
MFIRTQPIYRLWIIILVATAAAISASAQHSPSPEQPAKNPGDTTLTMQLVKTGLFTISGGGGNSLVRLSANGVILVDGKLPGNFDILRKRVHRLSELPIRVVVITDHYESHTGTNAKFLEAGTQIIAQENVKQNLTTYRPPSGPIAPPTITYDREYELKLGGAEAQLLHFGNAKTNGDTVVYFPNLKVVAVGDLFSAYATPNPDFSAGGSLVDWGTVLAEILKLDFDVVVPGMGPTVTRADLEAYKTKIDTVVLRATGLVQKGLPKDQLMAQLKTDDLGWKLNFTGEDLDRFYAELSQPKAAAMK